MNPNNAKRRSLHKFVMVGMGIWCLFILSLPLAYIRVSQTKPFEGNPFKGLRETETHKPVESYSSLNPKSRE